ncbi:hypothetical protein POM88_026773 [Heracleum sosnowskyi]|uniref:Pentatricopeptide repeat-containing protein n=1 Tax=Heracleum sosnowskyi TaxID=360622 RepID=A0AAD8MPJ6_9APIA|nr:hypothetical protein POM88_026773 [Heracleum sosnowskyi]
MERTDRSKNPDLAVVRLKCEKKMRTLVTRNSTRAIFVAKLMPQCRLLSYSLDATKCIHSGDANHVYAHIIDRINGLLVHPCCLKFRHMFRLANQAADFLAKLGLDNGQHLDISSNNLRAGKGLFLRDIRSGRPIQSLQILNSMAGRGKSLAGSMECPASVRMTLFVFLILAKVERFGCLEDLNVGSALVSGFARFGLLDIATEIFKQMGARNAVTLNGLMVGLVMQKRGEKAVDIFKGMNDLVKINSDTYVVLSSALAEIILPDEGRSKGKEVHGFVIRTGLSDFKAEIGNGLINMYARCDAIDDACSTFKLMRNKNSISWNSLISALDQNEHFEDSIMTFHDMRSSALIPSKFTLISAPSSCASLGWMRMGEQIH